MYGQPTSLGLGQTDCACVLCRTTTAQTCSDGELHHPKCGSGSENKRVINKLKRYRRGMPGLLGTPAQLSVKRRSSRTREGKVWTWKLIDFYIRRPGPARRRVRRTDRLQPTSSSSSSATYVSYSRLRGLAWLYAVQWSKYGGRKCRLKRSSQPHPTVALQSSRRRRLYFPIISIIIDKRDCIS